MPTDEKPITANMVKSPEVKISEPELTPEQEVIQAEIEAGKAVLAANNRLAKAREKLNASLQVDNNTDSKGYGVKIWAGTKILQCLYCPLDVPMDEEDRMIAHMNASHPDFQSQSPLYDNLGNALD